MNRYRVTYSTMRAGEFSEFSAADDTAAITHVEDAERYGWGSPVSLAEVTGGSTQRTLDLPQSKHAATSPTS